MGPKEVSGNSTAPAPAEASASSTQASKRRKIPVEEVADASLGKERRKGTIRESAVGMASEGSNGSRKKRGKDASSGKVTMPMSSGHDEAHAQKRRKRNDSEAKADAPVVDATEIAKDPGCAESISVAAKSQVRKTNKQKHERKRAKQRRHQKNLVKKDPEVAAAYLQAWRAREDGNSEGAPWKFNKATQAWLLRHAYDSELVPKDVFKLLLKYLVGLQGAARERLSAEADALVIMGGAVLKAEQPADEATKSKGEVESGQGDPEPEKPDGNLEESEEEVKARKLRLGRAKKIQAVMQASGSSG